MATDLQVLNFSSGHQSEPTTPPEYRDPSLASMYSHRNRYSSSNIMSPSSISSNRLSRSSSQLTSPPHDNGQNQSGGNESDKLPSRSVPGSRRSSSDRFSTYLAEIGSVVSPRTAPGYVNQSNSPSLRYHERMASLSAAIGDFLLNSAEATGTRCPLSDQNENLSRSSELPDSGTSTLQNFSLVTMRILDSTRHHPWMSRSTCT